MVQTQFLYSRCPFSVHGRSFASSTCITLAVLLFACGFVRAEPIVSRNASRSFSEYEIKAGFMYRFISFVSWPEDSLGKTIQIGIFGGNPFGDAFDEIDGSTIDGRTVKVVYFGRYADKEDLRNCQLLFVAHLSGSPLRTLLDSLSGSPVLTIGDGGAFVDQGGMIGFVDEAGGRIGIEINVHAASRSGLTIRSMLRRIAGRVIEEPYHNHVN